MRITKAGVDGDIRVIGNHGNADTRYGDGTAATGSNGAFTAISETIHVICEITDNGVPNLTSYRRIIFEPK